VTVIPGVVFSGDIGGILRAYDAKTGRIIWDTDTQQEFKTVNGVAAHGGSLNGPGPVIVSGMLYVKFRLRAHRHGTGQCAAGVFDRWEVSQARHMIDSGGQ
jgi:outer membrane protein assembly factor BamB